MYTFNMLLGGFLMGVGVTLKLVQFHPSIKLYETAIAQCEKSLPRDQHCVITAVPK